MCGIFGYVGEPTDVGGAVLTSDDAWAEHEKKVAEACFAAGGRRAAAAALGLAALGQIGRAHV